MTSSSGRPVVVCTKYRGVFFGYADETQGDTIILKHARMCVYWDKALHGVMGLASSGPSSSCRVGPAVPQIELRGVSAIVAVEPQAVEKWEAEPWN